MTVTLGADAVKTDFRYRLRHDFERPVRLARLLTASVLEASGLDHLIHDAALIVTELASNAVRVTPGDIWLYLAREEHEFFMGVWDGDPNPPPVPSEDLMGENGRGLLLIQSLSTRYGYEPLEAGKMCWARLAISRG